MALLKISIYGKIGASGNKYFSTIDLLLNFQNQCTLLKANNVDETKVCKKRKPFVFSAQCSEGKKIIHSFENLCESFAGDKPPVSFHDWVFCVD